jgi:hypothetical protein
MTTPMTAHGAPIGGYGSASSKVPPEWDPCWNRSYPYKLWVQDVMMWAASTELAIEQRGPALVLRLSGAARDVCRTLDPAMAAYGTAIDLNDGNGPRQFSGLACILRGLSKEFAPLDYENAIATMSDLLSFRRLPSETIDVSLSRFHSTKQLAANEGHELPAPFQSFLLLKGLGVQPLMWRTFLSPFEGRLPDTPQQLTELGAHIRRQGHLLERDSVLTGPTHGPTSSHHTSYFGEPAQEQEQQDYSWQGPGAYASNGPGAYASTATEEDITPGSECLHCGMYIYDECDDWSSSGTEDEDIAYLVNDDVLNQYEQYPDRNSAATELRAAYLIARARFRRFSGKPTRFTRRPYKKGSGRRYNGKGQRKGKSFGFGFGFPNYHYSSEPVNTYFGGKKGGSGNGKGHKGGILLLRRRRRRQRLWRRKRERQPNRQRRKTLGLPHVRLDRTLAVLVSRLLRKR